MALPDLDEDDDDDAPAERGGPSRPLAAAWMGLAVLLGLAVGYVLVAAPNPDGGGERTALETRLPPRSESQKQAEPDAQRAAETQKTASRQSQSLQPHGVPLAYAPDRQVDTPLAQSIGIPLGTEIPAAMAAGPHTTAAGGPTWDAQKTASAPQLPTPQEPAVAMPLRRDGGPGAGARDSGGAGALARNARSQEPVGEDLDRIAVVIRGLGLHAGVTKAAIDKLPGGVTLSFSAYGNQMMPWMQKAREDGHELLLDLPMQPVGFPIPDPGDRTLVVDDPPQRNLERLRTILDRGSGHVGVVARYGGTFVTKRAAIAPVLRELSNRGLVYVGNGRVPGTLTPKLAAEFGVPHVQADAVLDRRPVGRSVAESWLAAATRTAQESGLALVVVDAYPMTVDMLASWTRSLDRRRLALVPVSAAIDRQDAPQAAQLR